MKPKFENGARVELVREHVSLGTLYDSEARPGAIGIINYATDERDENGKYINYSVTWETNNHPDREDGNGSCVDEKCLAAERPVTEDEMSEVYKSLGVERAR